MQDLCGLWWRPVWLRQKGGSSDKHDDLVKLDRSQMTLLNLHFGLAGNMFLLFVSVAGHSRQQSETHSTMLTRHVSRGSASIVSLFWHPDSLRFEVNDWTVALTTAEAALMHSSCAWGGRLGHRKPNCCAMLRLLCCAVTHTGSRMSHLNECRLNSPDFV